MRFLIVCKFSGYFFSKSSRQIFDKTSFLLSTDKTSFLLSTGKTSFLLSTGKTSIYLVGRGEISLKPEADAAALRLESGKIGCRFYERVTRHRREGKEGGSGSIEQGMTAEDGKYLNKQFFK